MSKVTDFNVSPEVTDIMVKMTEKFPKVFPGFDTQQITVSHTNGKTCSRKPLKIYPIKYPYSVLIDKAYIIEVAQDTWQEMNDKQKRLAVFHTMCAIPEGAFDSTSKNYAGKKKPDYEIYDAEFAVSGGVPNWMDNEEAQDPLEQPTPKKATGRVPVTKEDIATA